MLERPALNDGRRRDFVLSQHCVADVAVVSDDFACAAHVLAVVTTEAARRIEVADVVRVRAPVRPHLREEVGLIDALHFCNRPFDQLRLLRIEVRVTRSIEAVETTGN